MASFMYNPTFLETICEDFDLHVSVCDTCLIFTRLDSMDILCIFSGSSKGENGNRRMQGLDL